MDTLNIAYQQLFSFDCSKELVEKTLQSLLKERWARNEGNRITVEQNLWAQEEYQELTSWVEECLSALLEELKSDTIQQLKVVAMWANRSGRGDWHHEHKHAFSMVSGILYLTEDPIGTEFKVPSIWNQDSDVLPFLSAETTNRDWVSTQVNAKRGRLVLFPSSLMHRVPVNTSETERITLSFNAFPRGPIGHLTRKISLLNL